MTAVLGISIGALTLLGAPLFIGLFALVLLLYPGATPPLDVASYFVDMNELTRQPYLAPIVLFTLAGYVLARGNAPKRILRVADAALGWAPGGLAIVTVVTLAFFTAFTGASGVTIIALGGILFPLMHERGYPEDFSLGLITGAGSIGLLFFPSLPVFLYVTVATIYGGPRSAVTPEDLFLAGLLPGLLMVAVLSFYSMFVGVKRKIPRTKVSGKELGGALLGSFWELTLPLWIFALLLSGTIGLLEVPVFVIVYVMFVELVVYRDLHPTKDLPKVLGDGLAMVGAIVVILAVIIGLNNFLKDQRVPDMILAYIQDLIGPDDKLMFLVGLNVFLLIVGCLMDIFSALVAVLPLILPIAESYNINPLHLGVIFLANLEVGYLTPPVGMNLFISSLNFKKPITLITRAIVPFLILLLFTLVVITYVPELSTALPEAVNKDAIRYRRDAAPGEKVIIADDPLGDLMDIDLADFDDNGTDDNATDDNGTEDNATDGGTLGGDDADSEPVEDKGGPAGAGDTNGSAPAPVDDTESSPPPE